LAYDFISSAFNFTLTNVFLSDASVADLNTPACAVVLNFGLYQKKYATAEKLTISNKIVAVSFIKNFMEALSGFDA
jgi:hypothetical protein